MTFTEFELLLIVVNVFLVFLALYNIEKHRTYRKLYLMGNHIICEVAQGNMTVRLEGDNLIINRK